MKSSYFDISGIVTTFELKPSSFEVRVCSSMILDHFTVHTKDLERASLFYQRILGLKDGYRPPFDGPPGSWLYSTQGHPVVHLYAGREEADDLSSAVDHIAFQVHDLEEILGRLQDNNVSFEKVTVPELGTTQIFFSDPDGIQIELNFDCQNSDIPT